MTTVLRRTSSDALRGRAAGVITGSLIACGWAIYGLRGFAPAIEYPALLIAAGITLALVLAGRAMARKSRSLPVPRPEQARAARRARRFFWLNLVGEIVLLNIAVNLLAAPSLHRYWIPAISAVVGLHFWPMAIFFRQRSYWWVGAAMMLGALAATIVLIGHSPSPFPIDRIEALANAIILWTALATGAIAARATEAPLESA